MKLLGQQDGKATLDLRPPRPVLSNTEHKRGPEVTSQGVQTSSPGCKQEKEDKEEKKDAAE